MSSLLQTYDSSAMLDKYLPKMEQALDCNRAHSLSVLSEASDFQSLYGVDDMTSLSRRIRSNFQAW